MNQAEEKIQALREIEVPYLSTMLAESIARLGYPVGCGVAPHEDATMRAAEALFDRFAKLAAELAKQEPVGVFDQYGDSYIQIKPEHADETSVKLYAAPVVPPDMVMVPREPTFTEKDMNRETLLRKMNEAMDEVLVQAAASMMRHKLAKARDKGRGGWWNPKECTAKELRESMEQHTEKGDPVDVMNLAAMVAVREMLEAPNAEAHREVACIRVELLSNAQ